METLVPLQEQALDLGLDSSSQVEVLRRLGHLAAGVCDEIDPGAATSALLARERLGSTVVGAGLALPHARLEGLRSPVVAAARLCQPVDFDGQQVSLAIALFVPADAIQQHLELLASWAALGRTPGRLQALLAAPDADRFLALTRGV